MADKIDDKRVSWDNPATGTPNFKEIDRMANSFAAKSERLGDPTHMIWLPNSVHRTNEQAKVQGENKEVELNPAQKWQAYPAELNFLERDYLYLRKKNALSQEAADAKDKYDIKVAEMRGKAKNLLLSTTFSGKISENSFNNIEKAFNKHDISLLTPDGRAPKEE